MNLRGRTLDNKLQPKADVKTKPKPPRRSERNKAAAKEETKPSKAKTSVKSTPQKESQSRPKKKYPKKSQKKNDHDEGEEVYFPPVINTGIKDVIDILDSGSPDDSKLALEASIIYECKYCNMLFREISDYVKHKQLVCTSLVVGRKAGSADDWNPFMSREVFSLCTSDDEATDDYVIGLRDDS